MPVSRWTARVARDKIAEVLDLVAKGQELQIRARGKVVASVGSLQRHQDLRDAPRVPVSDVKGGRRTFSGVLHHGAFVITRHDRDAAVVFAPKATVDAALKASSGALSADSFRRLSEEVLETNALRDQIERRVAIRRQAEAQTRAAIAVLERCKPDEAAGLARDLELVLFTEKSAQR